MQFDGPVALDVAGAALISTCSCFRSWTLGDANYLHLRCSRPSASSAWGMMESHANPPLVPVWLYHLLHSAILVSLAVILDLASYLGARFPPPPHRSLAISPALAAPAYASSHSLCST
jgi:hypothetical protein